MSSMVSGCKRLGGFVSCAFMRFATFLAVFSILSYGIESSWLRQRMIRYFNIFDDVSKIPAIVMSILYIFGYIVNDYYVGMAKCLSCDEQDVLVRQMTQIYSKFISLIPGFLMAYVCATISKVSIDVRTFLTIAYALSTIAFQLGSCCRSHCIANLGLSAANAACLQLFLFSYVPQYARANGAFKKPVMLLVKGISSFVAKLRV